MSYNTLCSDTGTLPGLCVEVEPVFLCWFAALHLSSYLILPQSSPLDLGRPDNGAGIFDSFSQGRIWNIQSGKFIRKALIRNKWQNFRVLPGPQLKKRKEKNTPINVYQWQYVEFLFQLFMEQSCPLKCDL